MSMFTAIVAGGIKREASYDALSRSFFVASNPTAGTGIATADAATARSATANAMTVFNSDTTGKTARIIPVRLWIRATAINTSAADLKAVIYLDDIDRYTSGGTTLSSVACIDSGLAGFAEPTSKATINFGVLVTAAASDENKIYEREITTTILKADDEFDFWFGDAPSILAPTAKATGYYEKSVILVPPMWIDPGATMVFDTYGTSQAADPAWEVEFWYIENPNNN